MKDDKRFFKNCPKCSSEMSYNDKWNYDASIRKNKLCKRCGQTKKNMFSEYEIQFLLENYNILGPTECSKVLYRSAKAIQIKAQKLNLKFRNFAEHEKYCQKCKSVKSKDMFGLDNRRKDLLTPTCKECVKKYRDSHKSHKLQYDRQYVKDRWKNDVEYRIVRKMRANLRTCLKNYKLKKTEKTFELIGCSIETFRKHMEQKFQVGMNWDNHGVKGWHIDHIIPCSHFDLKNIEEQKKCFHYTNLQPLWWYDNLSKSDKLI